MQINVALFGGVYGSQPVGREMVMRLARHIAEGAKRNDVTVSKLLSKINIYFMPKVDGDGFEKVDNTVSAEYQSPWLKFTKL